MTDKEKNKNLNKDKYLVKHDNSKNHEHEIEEEVVNTFNIPDTIDIIVDKERFRNCTNFKNLNSATKNFVKDSKRIFCKENSDINFNKDGELLRRRRSLKSLLSKKSKTNK